MDLTKNGVEVLVGSFADKETKNLNLVLQVFSVSSEQKNGEVEVQTFKLSDGKLVSFSGMRVLNAREDFLKENQIIKVFKVKYDFLPGDTEVKTFLLLKYEIIATCPFLIGKPVKCDEQTILDKKNALSIIEKAALPKRSRKPKYTLLRQLTKFAGDITLKVRINKVHTLKKYKNHKNQGTLLNLILIDQQGDEILATAFDKNAVELEKRLKELKVYSIKRFTVHDSNPKYCSVKNRFKLIFYDKTEIEEVFDSKNMPFYNFEFIPLKELDKKEQGSTVDIVAKILEIEDPRSVNAKYSTETVRQIIKIGDLTGHTAQVTIWTELLHLDKKVGDIVAFKHLRVTEFNGKNLSAIEDTTMKINPELPESNLLKSLDSMEMFRYYQRISRTLNLTDHRVYLSEMFKICKSKKYDNPLFLVDGVLRKVLVRKTNYYMACNKCFKKAQEKGVFYCCVFCRIERIVPIYFMNLLVQFSDVSGSTWVEVFGRVAEELLEIKGGDYATLIDSDDKKIIEEVHKRVENKSFDFVMKPRFLESSVIMSIKYQAINLWRSNPSETMRSNNDILDLIFEEFD